MNQDRGIIFILVMPILLLSALAGILSWMLSFYILLALVLIRTWYGYNWPRSAEPVPDNSPAKNGKTEDELLKAKRLYSFMSALNQMIIRTKDEESLFREVCRIAVDVGKFRMAWIGVMDPEKKEIVPIVFSGFEKGYLSQIQIPCEPDDPKGDGPTGTAIKTGKPVVCKDISTDPKMKIWKKETAERGYRSSISLPIFKMGKIVGALTLYADSTNFFDETEVHLLVHAAEDVSFGLDILEKDRQKDNAEEAAKRSQKRHHTLAEISPVGIFYAGSDGITTYVNPKWCEIAGVQMAQSLGYPWTRTAHPEDWENVQEYWRKLILKNVAETIEFRFLRPDETIAWVIAQTAPDYDPDAGAHGFLGIITDITKRKKAEEELENREKRFRALIENSTDGLMLVSKYGVVQEMGPSGKRVLGYEAEDIVGKTRFDLIHPEDVARVHDTFLEVIGFPNQVKTMEYRHIMPNGESKWLECSFNNLLDKPYLNAVVLNYRDISGRKLVESQIQESENKYRKAEAIGKMGHWERDLISGKLYWSDEIYRIFGLRKDQLDNRYERFLQTLHPDDRPAFEKAQEELVAGTKSMDIVHRILTGAGDIKYVQEIAEAVADDSGKIIRLSGTVQDITLLVRARNEILLEKQLSDSIINSMPGAFYLYTREGRFLRWNTNFEQITGYGAGEIIDMHPLDFFDAGEKQTMADKIEEVFRKGHSTVEASFLLKNRNKIPYFFTGSAIEYNGQLCLAGVGVDISERVSAEEKLKLTSEQLRQLAANLQDIREEERVSMAREIHDELGQQLTGLKMDVYWLKEELPPPG